jgi:hypothetical protein
MTVDIILIGFAVSAGPGAFLNPYGFAMLPTSSITKVFSELNISKVSSKSFVYANKNTIKE